MQRCLASALLLIAASGQAQQPTVPAGVAAALLSASDPTTSASTPFPAGAAASAPVVRERIYVPAPSPPPPPPSPPPSEFERYVNDLLPSGSPPLRRFGSLAPGDAQQPAAPETSPRVPPQYVLQPGDELLVALWGSVDADWRLRIDRAGRVVLPRAGPVHVAGVTVAELTPLLQARLARVYRNFEISASVADVSPIRVQLTGFVEQPGVYTVPGLTTLSAALRLAQGPSAGGSFRRILLMRDGRNAGEFDSYALLVDGRRGADRLLQPDDVIHVEPVGPQVAVLGSVNRRAIFEFRDGETVADALRLAGGPSSLADRSRAALERLQDRTTSGVVEIDLPRQTGLPLRDGDVLRVFSVADAARPTQRNKHVRVEGEVRRPGDYVLPPAATLADAVAAAGGLTASAFPFGAEFRRESVRRVQQSNYERALRELESQLLRSNAARRDDDGAARRDSAARQLLDRLRRTQPEGRLVLDVQPMSAALPALALEDGDQLLVPSRPDSVGVFGSVHSSGSFLYDGTHDLGYYLRRAGGPTPTAEDGALFVVRANGSVLSARERGRWLGTSRFGEEPALPGDTVFVPEEIDRSTWREGARDWTQILYQFGVGIAALVTIL